MRIEEVAMGTKRGTTKSMLARIGELEQQLHEEQQSKARLLRRLTDDVGYYVELAASDLRDAESYKARGQEWARQLGLEYERGGRRVLMVCDAIASVIGMTEVPETLGAYRARLDEIRRQMDERDDM